MTVITLDKDAIQEIDLTPLSHHLDWKPEAKGFFLSDAGREHYKLLAYLSKYVSGDIVDIGTYWGASALALSYNDDVRVLTFDIVRNIPQFDPKIPITTPLSRNNIKMYVASGQSVIAKISKCQFACLDIDPHDGIRETDFVNRLINHDFKGILLVDDINVNKEMRLFWENLPSNLKKLDVTHLGHASGTGIIVFDPSFIDVTL